MDWRLSAVAAATFIAWSTLAALDPDKLQLSFNIKGDGRISLSEHMAIPVMRMTNLILVTKYCGYFSIFLHSLYERTKDGEIRVDITPDYVALTSCPSMTDYNVCIRKKTVQKDIQILTCQSESTVWLKWDSNGHVTFGQGHIIGEKTLLDHNAAVSYPIRYIYLMKVDKDTDLFTVIYDNEPPVPDSLVLTVREDVKVRTIIHTFPTQWKCHWKRQSDLPGLRKDNLVAKGLRKSIFLLKRLDYEQKKAYNFPVRCMREMTYVNLTVWIHVLDCNNNHPQLKQVGKLTVLEELPVGTGVGPWLKATDRDHGDTLSYRLTGQHSHYFHIDNRTGGVSVAHRIDRESIKFLYLSLTVADAAGHTITANMTIQVLDINDNQPLFEKGLYRLFLSIKHRERLLTKFHISDKDGNAFRLKITAGNEMNIFSLDNTAMYANLQELMDLNVLEKHDWQFLISVEVWDRPKKGTALHSTAYVFISVEKLVKFKKFPVIHYKFKTIEQTESMQHKTITVPENVELKYQVIYKAHYSKADPESIATGHQQYHLRSDLACTGGNRADDYFTVDPKTGDLTVKRQLDADVKGCTKYKISFYLSNYRELTHTYFTVLTVNVQEVNDNVPIAIPRYAKARLPCHPYPKHRIARFRFKDGDIGKAKFKVTVDSKNTFQYDLIPTRKGLVVAIGKNEKTWTKHFRHDIIRLKVTDGGSPQLSSVAVVSVESGCSRKTRRQRKGERHRREIHAGVLTGTKQQNWKLTANHGIRKLEIRNLTSGRISGWTENSDAANATDNRRNGDRSVTENMYVNYDNSQGFKERTRGKTTRRNDARIVDENPSSCISGSTDEVQIHDSTVYNCLTGSDTAWLILLTMLLAVSATANVIFLILKLIKRK